LIRKDVPMKYLRVFTSPLVIRSATWGLPLLLLIQLTLLVALPIGTAVGSDSKAPLAYVTQRDAQPDVSNLCSVSGSVSVIDTTNNQVLATVFEVGPGPHGMAITSDGDKAYVANYGTFPSPFEQATCLSDTVAVLKLIIPNSDDAEDSQAAQPPEVVTLVKVGRGPLGVAVTPDDEEVYVTNFGQDKTLAPEGVEGNTVSVIKTRSNEVVATIQVGELPAGVAIRPDGKRAYVTSRRKNKVWVLDTVTHQVVTTVDVQMEPANVAFTPDGRLAYVANFGSNSVSVIDTATNTVVPVPDGEAIKVGVVPIGVAVTPDGARVYVVNVNFSPVPPPPLGNVSVIDTATNTVVDTVVVGSGPRAVAITPDGAHAYVTNFVDNTLSVIETATNTVVDTVPEVAGGPNWVTITGGHRKVHKKHH
jgi:YVTN family beta-propeller protein